MSERKKGSKPTYLLRKFLQHSILKPSPNEGSVCLNYDAMGAAVVNNGLLLAEGVELKTAVTTHTSVSMC